MRFVGRLRYEDLDGKWRSAASGFVVGQEELARQLLTRVEKRVAARRRAAAELAATVDPVTGGRPSKTVRLYAAEFVEHRRSIPIRDWKNDESRLRNHVLPHVGALQLADVRPRHVLDLVEKLRRAGKVSPKTLRNVYGVLRTMFHRALLEELVERSPCVLTKHELGPLTDKDPTWRRRAVYTRKELEMLISDERVPPDRRVFYAIEGVGGLRHGEAAGLRWRSWEPTARPLGRLEVSTSYDSGRTKTGKLRYLPVHPALAAVLSEWKLEGWAAMFGRLPGPDDLVVPLPCGPRVRAAAMRTRHHSHKRLRKDLEALGLRHRRGHDLRRTMISLSRSDGARKDLLEVCTHNRRGVDVMDAYTEFTWASLCAEVAKLNVQRLGGEVVALEEARMAAAGDGREGARVTSRVTASGDHEGSPEVERWRRRESNAAGSRLVSTRLDRFRQSYQPHT